MVTSRTPHPVPPWTAALRAWQERAYLQVMSRPDVDTLIMATPGGGKTKFALRVVHALLAAHAADRGLVVCPTNHLRRQWALEAAKVGLQFDPDLGGGLETHDYQGAVVTYQQVCWNPEPFRVGCRTRRTVVIFDEIHHAGDTKGWGQALAQAFGEYPIRRVALSGTPFRSDNTPIPFVRYVEHESRPDFTYSYGEALRDRVCRPILFPTYEGDLSWRSNGQTYHATFRQDLEAARAKERLKTALLQPDWLTTVMQDAHATLRDLRGVHPDVGGLVIAMTQEHARQAVALLKSVTGGPVALAISDDPEASATIQAFGRSRDPWLVAVNMVSEGVDIPRLRVGIFATHVQTEMYFRQVVGRFVRVQPGLGPSQRAYLYLPRDPVLVAYAEAIKAERDHVLQEEAVGDPRATSSVDRPNGSTFVPLAGTARADAVISVELTEPDLPLPVEPVFVQKQQLRERHHHLVAAVARYGRLDHRRIHLELLGRFGGRVETATVTQLERRIRQLERWKDYGYDG